MKPAHPFRRETLPYSAEVRIDEICMRFEESWKSGQQPRLEGYLADWPSPQREALFEELLKLELSYRTSQGEKPTLEEYSHRFPEHDSLVETFFTVNSEDTLPSQEKTASFPFLSPPQGLGELGRLGSYRILKVLGGGGMGIVFQAEDVTLERLVALKVMQPELAAQPTFRQRFLREAKATAALQHDHIVTIYQVGEANELPFLAMELLEGRSLDDWLKRGGRPAAPQIVRLGREIALGLSAAHDRGLIHRDIKPSNLWIEREHGGRVKILDFGLVRLPQKEDTQLTSANMILGTPAYMAPEMVNHQAMDHRCDIYSLGVILYQLCTGQLPFQGETVMAMLLASSEKDARPVRELNPEIPGELEELVSQLLAKDPRDRPASARAVAEKLQALERSLEAISPSQVAAEEEWRADTVESPAAAKLDTVPLGNAPAKNKAEKLKSPTARREKSPRRRWPAIAAGLLFVLLAVYGAFQLSQITYRTPEGVFIVEFDDKAVETRFKNGQIQIYDDRGKLIYTLRASERNKKLQPGKYRLKVAGADGLELDTEEFTMKKNGRKIVHVRLQAPVFVAQKKNGKANYALEFDGKSSYVDLQSFRYDGKHPVTMEAWVTCRLAKQKNDGGIICPNTIVENGRLTFLERKDGTAAMGFHHFPSETDELQQKPGEKWPYVGARLKNVTQPIHVAGVFDGKQIRIYVNGEWRESSAAKGRQKPMPTNYYIGAIVVGDSKNIFAPFDGTIDEVRISKVARYTKNFTPQKRFEPDKDTMALYHFDEASGNIAKDSSGNGHHGKIVGAKWVKEETGGKFPPIQPAANFALEFDGKSSGVDVPNFPYDGAHPITIEARVKSTPIKGTMVIVQPTGAAVHLTRSLGFAMSARTKDAAFRHVADINREGYFHAAGVFDGKRLRLFLNGKPTPNPIQKLNAKATTWSATSEAIKDILTFPLANLTIGRSGFKVDAGNENFFRGVIDEVRISNVVRYTNEFTPPMRFEPDKDTMALYHFDEASGDIAKDSSGNGRHGKIVGAKWVKEVADGQFAPYDTDRRAAEWVLGIGGTVNIRFLGIEQQVKDVADLPAAPFQVLRVDLQDNQNVAAEGLRNVNGLRYCYWLRLQNTSITDADVKQLNDMPKLGYLDLVRTQITDEGVKELKRFPGLRTLELAATKITDDTLLALQGSKTLGGVFVGLTRVTDDGLKRLQALPNLTSVGVDGRQLTAVGAGHLARCKNLTRLLLSDPPVLEHLKQLSHLTTLRFWQLTDDDLKHVYAMRNLQRLDLYKSPITDAGLQHLKGLKTLKRLTLSETKVTAAGVAELQKALPNCKIFWDGHPDRRAAEWVLSIGGRADVAIEGKEHRISKLTELPQTPFHVTRVDLDENDQLRDRDLSHLSGLVHCHTLTFFKTPIGDVGVTLLEDLRNLENINLSRTRVTDEGIKQLLRFPHLRGLGLNKTKVTNQALNTIGRLRGLRWLNISLTDITDDALSRLSSLPELIAVSMDNTQFTEKGARHLAACNNLFELRFSGPGGEKSLQRVSQLPNLTHLNYQSSGLVDQDLEHLKRMTNLTKLALVFDPGITDTGLAHLKALKNLQQLDLRGAKVTEQGITDLQKSLPECKILWDGEVDADRRAAEWALSIGGKVRIVAQGKSRDVSDLLYLPQSPFHLSNLELGETATTDTDLLVLKDLKNLSGIALARSQVTDTGLNHLQTWPNLTSVSVDGRQLTETGAAHLAKCQKLGQLRISRPADLKHLRTLSDLSNLHLADGVEDDDLNHLHQMKRLRRLTIIKSPVSDVGLERLKALETLQHLQLSETKVTPKGVAALEKALPKCKVIWDGKVDAQTP